jgi:hypothetical protein
MIRIDMVTSKVIWTELLGRIPRIDSLDIFPRWKKAHRGKKALATVHNGSN